MGALSPRTRNAQVALYQSGDVDFLVATDAIGMGLNLDVDHVAFAADRKFDGAHAPPAESRRDRPDRRPRRAGICATAPSAPPAAATPFEPELVTALEDHVFDPVKILQWRNSELDFSTVAALIASLERQPTEPGLTRAIAADDLLALEIAARDDELRGFATSRRPRWKNCGKPARSPIIARSPRRRMPISSRRSTGSSCATNGCSTDWIARQVAEVDRTDGDIDALSNRIAQVRTWTFVANRPDWLGDPEHWQGVTRQVEDRLSDALHERLAQRFVDRRTSVLMRRLRENAMLEAEITAAGDVLVEGHHVGRLQGFQFAPDPQAGGPDAKALRNAAAKALGGEIENRAARLSGRWRRRLRARQ